MLEKVKEALLPVIESHDCYLDDLVYEKEHGEMYLRVFIEKNEGSLDMDTCVAVSEEISAKLDEIDLIKDEYYLEVSSPGIEKPLRTWDKIEENVGSYVHIDFKNPFEGMEEVEGTLLLAQDQKMTLEYMKKAVKKKCVIDYENAKFVRLAVRF